MLERVGRVGRLPVGEHEVVLDQPLQAVQEQVALEPRHLLEQAVVELAAENGRVLGDPFRGAQAVEPRHQRVLERRRDLELVDRADERELPVALGDQSRIEHHPPDLFREQRHAVRLVEHPGDDRLREGTPRADPVE